MKSAFLSLVHATQATNSREALFGLTFCSDPLWGNEASRNTNPEISPRLSSVTSEPDTYYQLFDTMRPSIVLACLVGAVSAQRSQAELDQLDKDTTCVVR